MAHLCMKHAAEAIIYVFDLSEISYPIEDQIELFKDIQNINKETIVYFSKNDIIDKKIIENFQNKEIKGIYDINKLKLKLVSLN
jgi:GTP1/Obg family GTP-binding protein